MKQGAESTDNSLELKKIVEICRKYPFVQKVVLFGSRARGDEHPHSDFDIALYVTQGDISLLKDEVEEIPTLLHIDITAITQNTSDFDALFIENIKKEGIVIDCKLNNKLMNFHKAVGRLQETIVSSHQFAQYPELEEVFRDSLIQRFEFCYELAWKTLEEYLIYQGLSPEHTPRRVLKVAYQHQIIEAKDIWISMISDRNMSSHEYSEEKIVALSQRIVDDYVGELLLLSEKIAEWMDDS